MIINFQGKGTQVWKTSGAIYDGDWKFGKRDGYGTHSVVSPETKEYTRKYCGGWKNGKKHVSIRYTSILALSQNVCTS